MTGGGLSGFRGLAVAFADASHQSQVVDVGFGSVTERIEGVHA